MFSLLGKHFRKTRTPAPGRKVGLALEALEDRTVPTLLGNSLFPADYPWNQKITNAPVAGSSSAIISNIITQYGDGRLHPDFGQDSRTSSDLYGIPYNVVHGNSAPRVHVVIDAYPGESDLQDAPVPANAVLEGDKQNGPTAGVNARGDSHLLVYDLDNNVAYEFYRASRPAENSDGQWHADQETVWNMKTDQFRTLGWTSADAAGLAILPGLVRPDEGLPVSQGGQGVINHAIRFTLQNSLVLNQFLYPASHTANPGNNSPSVQPPMGARFRLKAGVDLSTLNPESRVIAQAMKDYGLVLADNGSNFFFSGASYSVDAGNGFALTWNDNDIQDSTHGLKSLTFSDFEVVDLTPVVTGLSETGGSAGDTVTITGQNFSGAAGHLSVLFGGAAATNVTVVDDGHVTATVPAGSGTVDVRVQSGVADPSDPSNIKSPVFGYGVSAVTAADRFTYGGSTGNQLPVVVDNGGPGYVESGPDWQDRTTSLGYGGNLAYAPAGSGQDTTSWQVSNLAAGTYEVDATWYAYGNRATNAPYSVYDGSTLLATVTVNQQQAPSGTTVNGFPFQSLGTFSITSGTLKVVLSNNANGYVIADAVRFALASPQTIVDNGQPGYTESGPDWQDRNTSLGYGGNLAYAPAGTGQDTVSWQLTNLAPGRYDVQTTWYAYANRATNAPYSIYDGNTLLATVTVNQQVAPSGTSVGGFPFQSLGTFNITSGTLKVVLSNSANGYVFADALRAAPPQTIVDNGQPGYTESGPDWQDRTTSLGYGGNLAYAPAGSGQDTASWQVTNLAAGSYEVDATWYAYGNRATNAPYSVYDGNTLLATVTVNQQLAPSGVTVNGFPFQSLGTFKIQSGTLRVVLSNNANGYVFADALRVIPS